MEKMMELDTIKMAALGRRFQLGDLYNYRNDCILTDCRFCWGSANSATVIQLITQFKLKIVRPESESSKWEHMKLEEHMKASTIAGLIENYCGASHYFNYRPNSMHQVNKTLVFRAKSRKECLDWPLIIKNIVLPTEENDEFDLPNATHVVTGVIYGAEAYLVLSLDLAKNGEEDDEEARDEAEEKLCKLTTKIENALNDNLDLAEFKEHFDQEEKKQLNLIKCRLFADLQSSSVRECGIFDAYKCCQKLMHQISNPDVEKTKAVPVTVLLCPLGALIEPIGKFFNDILFKYRDIERDLIDRCCDIWIKLDEVIAKADAIRQASTKCNRASMRQLKEVVEKYQDMLKKSLEVKVVKARDYGKNDEEIGRLVHIIENHSIFKPSQLQRWFRLKSAEMEMAGKIGKINNVVFLENIKQLDNILGDTFDKKISLILNVPALDEETSKILEIMKTYVETYTKLIPIEGNSSDDEENDDGLPWHMVQHKRKQVFDKIRELSDYTEKNIVQKNKVQFFIVPQREKKKFSCSYSIYQDEDLLIENVSRLPCPPIGLEISLLSSGSNKTFSTSTPSIRLKWHYEDLGFPHYFIVEYRSKDSSDCWKQQTTTKPGQNQMILHLKDGPAMEFRVATKTCIGCSEFSEIVDTDCIDVDVNSNSSFINKNVEDCRSEEVEFQQQLQIVVAEPTRVTPKTVLNKRVDLQPPSHLEVDIITQTTAELAWRPPSVDARNRFFYRVQYWSHGDDPSRIRQVDVDSNKTSCRIEQLLPETKYFIRIVAVSLDGQEKSEPCQYVELTTLDNKTRFAETIRKSCRKICSRNGMDFFAVPLIKSTRSQPTIQRFVFGKVDSGGAGRMQHKTILVMGATGSGKTTLINGMINYIFNVEWQDCFRFQLIEEQLAGRSQANSQTSQIMVYDIHHMEGFRIPYSLTIVDTPGYGDTKGLERDQEITEMIRKFFEDKDGIQQIDVVGFVAQASLPRLTPSQIYIFDSVLSIFGNDIKENINFLLTFADSQVPPILDAITEASLPCPTDPENGDPLHHKFNNSGFFCSSRESTNAGGNASSTVDKFNRFFWRMGMENFQLFFSSLARMETKSLTLTKQVLDERKKLEATVDGLQPLIKTGLAKMEEMRKTKQIISNSQMQIDANENVEFQVEVTVPTKVEIPVGLFLTNCNKCYVTCHYPCAIPNDDQKTECWAMDHSMPRVTRSCRICPHHCIWNLHVNQSYRWEYVQTKQATSSDAIKRKYESELKRKLTAQELVDVLQKDVDSNKKAVLERVNIVASCIKRLDEIALRPNPFSTPQYIDLIIDAEQQEKKVGFKERIESLKQLREMAVITNKIKNKESLFSCDFQDVGDQVFDVEDDGVVTYPDEDDDSNGCSLIGAMSLRS